MFGRVEWSNLSCSRITARINWSGDLLPKQRMLTFLVCFVGNSYLLWRQQVRCVRNGRAPPLAQADRQGKADDAEDGDPIPLFATVAQATMARREEREVHVPAGSATSK